MKNIILPVEKFNKIIDNQEVSLFCLKNKNGFVCQIINFGARIVSLIIPRGNSDTDVVLGYDSIEDYQRLS